MYQKRHDKYVNLQLNADKIIACAKLLSIKLYTSSRTFSVTGWWSSIISKMTRTFLFSILWRCSKIIEYRLFVGNREIPVRSVTAVNVNEENACPLMFNFHLPKHEIAVVTASNCRDGDQWTSTWNERERSRQNFLGMMNGNWNALPDKTKTSTSVNLIIDILRHSVMDKTATWTAIIRL